MVIQAVIYLNSVLLLIISTRTIVDIVNNPTGVLSSLFGLIQIGLIFVAVIASMFGKPRRIRDFSELIIGANVVFALAAIVWLFWPPLGEGVQFWLNLSGGIGLCSLFTLNAYAVAKVEN